MSSMVRLSESNERNVTVDSGDAAASIDALEVRRREILSLDWTVEEIGHFYGKRIKELGSNERSHVLQALYVAGFGEYKELASVVDISDFTHGSQLEYFRRLEADPGLEEEFTNLQDHLRQRAEQTDRELKQSVRRIREEAQVRRFEITERIVGHVTASYGEVSGADSPKEKQFMDDFRRLLLQQNGIPMERIVAVEWVPSSTIRTRIKSLRQQVEANPALIHLQEEMQERIDELETTRAVLVREEPPSAESLPEGEPAVEPDSIPAALSEEKPEVAEVPNNQPAPAASPKSGDWDVEALLREVSAQAEPDNIVVEPNAEIPDLSTEQSPDPSPVSKPKSSKQRPGVIREVPPEEQELFTGVRSGESKAMAEFESRYGVLVEAVLEQAEGDRSEDARNTAREALHKAARYFIPEEHTDFETWATKAIARDLERLQERIELDTAIQAVQPEVFVRAARLWREQTSRGKIVYASKSYREQVGEAKKEADRFLDTKLNSQTLAEKLRKELAKKFPDAVGAIALASCGLRHAESERIVPIFSDLTNEQKAAVMELVFKGTLESLSEARS